MEKELESLEKEWTKLAADLSKTWKSAVAFGKTEAGAEKDRLKTEMEKQFSALHKEIESTYGKGKKVVEKNPWKSLFLAFGMGLLIGKLMERRSK